MTGQGAEAIADTIDMYHPMGGFHKVPDPSDVAYIKRRMAELGIRILERTTAAFSSEAIREDEEFEKRVERKLQGGAKFIPRKRKSS